MDKVLRGILIGLGILVGIALLAGIAFQVYGYVAMARFGGVGPMMGGFGYGRHMLGVGMYPWGGWLGLLGIGLVAALVVSLLVSGKSHGASRNCTRCGRSLEAGWIACPHCGQPVEPTGASVDPGR